MKNYIEALLAREKARLDSVSEKQKSIMGRLEYFRKENQSLIMEASQRSEKINFLNEMLREENEDA